MPKCEEKKYQDSQIIEIVGCFLCSIYQREYIFREKKKRRGFEC